MIDFNFKNQLKVGNLIIAKLAFYEFLGEIIDIQVDKCFPIACLIPLSAPSGVDCVNYKHVYNLSWSKAYQHQITWLRWTEVLEIVSGSW